MNWDEVSAIGQVLGSVAVFVTLIYLAIQTRHSRREVRRSVSQSRAATVRELSLLRVQDPSLCQLHVKANLALAAGGQRPPFRQALIERVGLTPAVVGGSS